MYELKVTVNKVMGKCTANPAMKKGDHFYVNDGDIRIPEGGYVCLWALQSLIPLITLNERELSEKKDKDWMRRANHAQCPDPNGRVVFKLERTKKLENGSGHEMNNSNPEPIEKLDTGLPEEKLKDLGIEVESVKGKCKSRMKPGDKFMIRSGRLYIPPGGHLCFAALQATLPFMSAKQRVLEDGDWIKEDSRILCPDPAGNVILRIERKE